MSAASIFHEVSADLWVSFGTYFTFKFTLTFKDFIDMLFPAELFKFTKLNLIELANCNLLLRHFGFSSENHFLYYFDLDSAVLFQAIFDCLNQVNSGKAVAMG